MDVTHILAALKLIKRERVIEHDRPLCSVDSDAAIETVVEDTQDAAIVHSNLAIAVALQEVADKLADMGDTILSTIPKDSRPLLIEVGPGVWINPRHVVAILKHSIGGEAAVYTTDGKSQVFLDERRTPAGSVAALVDLLNI